MDAYTLIREKDIANAKYDDILFRFDIYPFNGLFKKSRVFFQKVPPTLLEKEDEGNIRSGCSFCYSITNFRISFVCGSIMCTAHARHGSNERIIRTILAGLSGSGTGAPIRDSSYCPRIPLSHLGDAFHVEGTTA
jgi:hypothetical protein